jgi:hypothetical protein
LEPSDCAIVAGNSRQPLGLTLSTADQKGQLMAKSLGILVSLGAILSLAGCQTEQRLTSVNPAFQSAESRALRDSINGATISLKSPDVLESVKDCTMTTTYARNGTVRREILCNRLVQESAIWTRVGAQGARQVVEGSWTVRDDQICTNIFRVNGIAWADLTQRPSEASCATARFSGNEGVIIDRNGPTRAVIIARGA